MYQGLLQLPNVVSFPDTQANAQASNPEVSFQGIEIIERNDIESEMSWLGTPILFPITFKGGVYKRLNNGRVEDVRLSDFRLPGCTVASFQRRKIKSKTHVGGGKGSVKELYGFDDWKIKIQGFLWDEPGHPQGADTVVKQQERLLEFEELADSIEVSGSLFSQKNIYRIDIDQIDFPIQIGKPRFVPFTLTCESDEPLELIL